MSDGGAQVIVETVSALAKFKVGRVVLWLAAAWLMLSGLTSHDGSAALGFVVALGLALVALIAGFLADRKKRAERAAFRSALAFVGLTLVTILGGVWLVFRRRDEPAIAPPSQEEVDALVKS